MKYRFTALILAGVLTSPLLTLGSSRPPVRAPKNSEVEAQEGVTRAVQQGKGSGMTRNDRTPRVNAYREQTPQESNVTRNQVKGARRDESAYRK
jgi:hypothetical protein